MQKHQKSIAKDARHNFTDGSFFLYENGNEIYYETVSG